MAKEDNILELLAQAPPSAPDSTTLESAQASQEAAAAKKFADSLNPTRSPNDSGAARPQFDATASPKPGTFGDHLATALQEARKNADATTLSEPGSWSKLMIGASMDALAKGPNAPVKPPTPQLPTSGVGSVGFTGDQTTPIAAPPQQKRGPFDGALATIGDAAGGGGFMGAAKRHTERNAQEMKDRQVMATSNAQMLHEQGLVHKQGVEAIDDSISQGKAAAAVITAAVPGGAKPGSTDAEGKTSDDLQQMIKSGEFKPSEQTAFPTGKIQTGKDANGFPTYRTTYSVVTPAGSVYVGPDAAKRINAALGTSYPVDADSSKQQVLPGVQLNAQLQKAAGAEAVKRALEVQNAKDQKVVDEAQNSAEAKTIRSNPVVVNAINSHNKSTQDTPDAYAVVKAYDYITNNFDKFKDKLPANFSQAYIQAAGGATEWNKLREEYAKAQTKTSETVDGMLTKAETDPKEIEGHTPAFTAAMKSVMDDPDASSEKKQRAAKILETVQNVRKLELELEGAKEQTKADTKAKAGRGPESDKVGEAFLATLPKSRRSLVEGIGEGRTPASPSALERTDKGQALLEDIMQAYTDFDAGKGETWYKNRNEYMGTGATAKAKVNYNTALEHLKALYDTSTKSGLYMPLSKDYRDRMAAFAIVTGEVGKAIKTGIMTEGEGKELRKALGGWTPEDAKERATMVGKLLYQKIGQFQQAFDDSAPSKMIKVPTIISPQAQASYDYVMGGGKTPEVKKYKVGDSFKQGDHQYRVTSVDDNGKVTGAE